MGTLQTNQSAHERKLSMVNSKWSSTNIDFFLWLVNIKIRNIGIEMAQQLGELLQSSAQLLSPLSDSYHPFLVCKDTALMCTNPSHITLSKQIF